MPTIYHFKSIILMRYKTPFPAVPYLKKKLIVKLKKYLQHI